LTYQYKPIASFAPNYDDNGQLFPFQQPNDLMAPPRIRVPKKFSDTSHVAHILWQYVELMEAQHVTNQQSWKVLS